jgi:membrane protein DedA with SNARE-associated domain
MSHLTWQKFAFWNAIAAFVWAVAFSNVGYAFGGLVANVPEGEDAIASGIHQAMLIVLGLFVLVMGFRVISTRIHKHHAKQTLDKL